MGWSTAEYEAILRVRKRQSKGVCMPSGLAEYIVRQTFGTDVYGMPVKRVRTLLLIHDMFQTYRSVKQGQADFLRG